MVSTYLGNTIINLACLSKKRLNSKEHASKKKVYWLKVNCSENAKDATGLEPDIVADVRKDAEITTG